MSAQQQAREGEGDTIFRSETRLVQVDVIVRNKAGAVKDLKKDDFTVLDNGKPQNIAIFNVRKVEQGVPPETLPPGVVANRPEAKGTEPVAGTVILLDYLNTLPQHQSFARKQALNYLNQSSRNEQIAVYALNKKLHVIQEFTGDRETLKKAITAAAPETSVDLGSDDLLSGDIPGMNSVQTTLENARTRREDGTAAAFATISRHLGGLPGRKKLVWVTSSIPMSFTSTETHQGVQTAEYQDFSRGIETAIEQLNGANIGVYPMDPRSVGSDDVLGDPGFTTMLTIAKNTGGQVTYPTNDLATAIETIMADTDLTYTLGYYRSGQELDGKFHKIEVKVDRPDVDVRNRKGYQADPPHLVEDKKLRRTLNAWVQEPLEATDIAIKAKAVPVANKPEYYQVDVAVNAAELQLENKNGRWVGSFDIAIAPDLETHPRGLLQTIKVNLTEPRLRVALASGIQVSNIVKITNADGKLQSKKLHVVVMDKANAKAGSVRLPVTYTKPTGKTQRAEEEQPQRPEMPPLRGGGRGAGGGNDGGFGTGRR